MPKNGSAKTQVTNPKCPRRACDKRDKTYTTAMKGHPKIDKMTV